MVEEKHDDEKSTLSDPASTLLREEDRKVNMSEDELKEMMFEANKTDREGVVYKSDFMSVL